VAKLRRQRSRQRFAQPCIKKPGCCCNILCCALITLFAKQDASKLNVQRMQ
jgi:hypothetical protein